MLEVGNSLVHLEATYPDIDFQWVEFKHGGDGVCVLTADELKKHQAAFAANMDKDR